MFACDRWLSHAENMLAIAKSVEAMRGLDRWGMADVVERVMGGFSALPAGDGSEYVSQPQPKKRPWREVLGGEWPQLDAFETLVLAKSRHQRSIESLEFVRKRVAAFAADLEAELAQEGAPR